MTDENKPACKANPAPLGLLGFGMTTVLLSLHNAGALPLDDVTLAMGVFCGGFAQIVAGIMEYRNGNTFGTVAFTLYGVFWLALIAIKTGIFGAGSGECHGDVLPRVGDNDTVHVPRHAEGEELPEAGVPHTDDHVPPAGCGGHLGFRICADRRRMRRDILRADRDVHRVRGGPG